MNSPTASKIQRAYDDVGKLPRRRDSLAIAIAYDAPRDLACASLLSEFKDKIGQFALPQLIHQVGRGIFAALIHSHIERRIRGETEPPVASVELDRRYSEIRENPSCLNQSRFVQH